MITVRYFLIVVFVLASANFAFASDSNVILQIGKFNGIPGKADAGLVKDEFSMISRQGRTLQIKKKQHFPQRLAPGQRIALFIDSITDKPVPRENNLLLTISLISDVSWKNRTPISVLFNKHPVWKAVCTENPQKISAIIPASYIEKGSNIIQIRNEGMNIVAFDAVKLERQTSFGTDEVAAPGVSDTEIAVTDDVFDKESKKILAKVKSDIHSFAPLGVKFQKRLLSLIPYGIVKYLQTGGKLFDFRQFAANKELFDPVSGKAKTIPWEPVKRLSLLFEGTPEIVACNLLPVARDDFIKWGSWCAVKNEEGVATLVCSTNSNSDRGKEIKVVLSLGWKRDDNRSVEAELKLINGFTGDSPETIIKPLKEKTEKIKIENGIFKYKFKLTRCTVIRVVRKGSKEPPPLNLPQKIKIKKSKPARLLVTEKRIPYNYFRLSLRNAGIIMIKGGDYIGKVADASRSEIDGAKNVIPWNIKSSFIEVSYPDGKASASEGALMHFGDGPECVNQLSFWVYPKATNKTKKVTLKFYFNFPIPGKNKQIYQCSLATGIWQRVVVPFNGKKPPRWGSICIFGNPKFPEYRKGGKVSFEFNGFCVFEKPSSFFHCRVIKAKAKSGKLSSMTVLFFGRPGKAGVYRHAFKYPVEFKKMSTLAKLPDGNKPELTYLKDTQILQVKYQFPKEYFPIPDNVMKLLTQKEKALISERAFLCTGVKIKF